MDQLYAQEGYVEVGYAVYVADAIALTAAEAQVVTVGGVIYDQIIEQMSLFDIGVTANLTVAPLVFLESDTDWSATAVKTAGADSTLDNIVNLSLQSDRFRDIIAAALAETAVEGQLSTLFNSTAQFNTEAVFVCEPLRIREIVDPYIADNYFETGYFEGDTLELVAQTQFTAQGGLLIEITDPYIADEYFDTGYFEGDTVDLPAQTQSMCEAELLVIADPVELNITTTQTAAGGLLIDLWYPYIDGYYFDPGYFEQDSEYVSAESTVVCEADLLVIPDPVQLDAITTQTTTGGLLIDLWYPYIDGNYFDPGYFEQDSEYVSAQAQLQAIGGFVKSAQANFTDTFDQITTADRIRATDSAQTSEFAQIAAGDRIRYADSSVDSAFEQSTTGDRTRHFASDQITDAQLTAQGVATKSAQANFTGAFSPTIKVDITLRGQVYMEFAAAMTVDAVRIKDSAVDPIESQATVTAQGMAVRISYSVYVRDSQPDPSPENNNAFGAAVSIDSNNTWWATAPGEGQNQGIAYQFRPELTINNPDPQIFSEFGSHAIAHNDNSVFVNYGGLRDTRVYEFSRSTGQLLKTRTSGGSTTDGHGRALSATNSRLAVGAPLLAGRGGVLVYNLNLAGDGFVGTIQRETDPQINNSQFGASVAITGNLLLIGAPYYGNIGTVFVYDINTLQFVRQIVNPNPFAQGISDQFGGRIAVWNNLVVVGSPAEANPTIQDTNSGIAYVFDVNTGDLVHTLVNPNLYSTSSGDSFGIDVAINESYIAVSATGEDTPEAAAGVIYLFSTQTGQLLTHIQNPNAFGTAELDQFSTRLALNENNWLIAGVRFEDSATATDTGHVYVFEIVVEVSEPVDVTVTAQMDVTATRIFTSTADVAVSATVTAQLNIIRGLSADVVAQTQLTAVGRIIDLNKEVWRITKENRTFAIQTETRDYTIAREQRVWSIA